jgi:hypothetical protein
MKVSFLTLTLLAFLVSCGKNNESGKSGLPTKGISPYTSNEETLIRQDFVKKGAELLRIYESQMKAVVGQRTVGLIRNKLKYDNVLVTHQYLYDGGHHYTRSVHRDDSVTLYIGRDETDLDWGQVRLGRVSQYNRLVMHELLMMGNVDDYNLVLTDRILTRRQGPGIVQTLIEN